MPRGYLLNTEKGIDNGQITSRKVLRSWRFERLVIRCIRSDKGLKFESAFYNLFTVVIWTLSVHLTPHFYGLMLPQFIMNAWKNE